MKKFLCLLLATMCFWALGSSESAANNSLIMNYPSNMNYSTNGNIDSLTISVKPQGLYAEVGLYMVFSPEKSYWFDNSWFKANDSLEVAMYFDMPENVMFIDSWLWFEGYIIKAKHYDRWTGSKIYEDIVHRTRRDPSIVYKNSATQYELRVFPIQGFGTRKIKITYLVPFSMTSSSAKLSLPFHLAALSQKATHTDVIVTSNDEFKNPKVAGYNDFSDYEDEFWGKYQKLALDNEKTDLTLSFDSPMKNGIYTNIDSIAKTYQLAYDMSQLTIKKGKKFLFVFDKSNNNTYYGNFTTLQLTNNFREFAQYIMTDADSFNLVVPNLAFTPQSTTWLPNSGSNLNTAFKFDQTGVELYSQFALELLRSVDWLEKNGGEGEIIVFTNNLQYNTTSGANPLLNEIMKLNTHKNKIHIVDYSAKRTVNPDFINNMYYYGNEYLYFNLTNLFGGDYYGIENYYTNDQDLYSLMTEAKKIKTGSINQFNYDLIPENGFTYSKYYPFGTSLQNYMICEVGKYYGDPKFSFKCAAMIEDSIRFKSFTLDGNTISAEKYRTEQIIEGLYIHDLEGVSNPSNQTIHEIINTALSNRVLSRYTVFLALEYGDTLTSNIQNDNKVGTDDGNTGVDEQETGAAFASVNASPNPFTNNVSINIDISEAFKNADLEVYITDLQGNKLKSFSLGQASDGKLNISWDGRSDFGKELASGVYLVVIKSGDKQLSFKLVKV